jgi:hypothetical protein
MAHLRHKTNTQQLLFSLVRFVLAVVELQVEENSWQELAVEQRISLPVEVSAVVVDIF